MEENGCVSGGGSGDEEGWVGGLAGTTAKLWVDRWFWASPIMPLSFLWLWHGVNDESVSEKRIFVWSGNGLKVISKCKTFSTLRGVFYGQLNVFLV